MTLQLLTFFRMVSTVVLHTNGLGSVLWYLRKSLMAATSSCTLPKMPRRRRWCVSLRNQLSTRFSHEAPVGVKCSWKRGVGGQPLAHRLVFVGTVVVEDDLQGEVGRKRAVEAPQELEEFLVPMATVAFADDLAGQHVQCGRTASSCRGACSRGSWCRCGPASSAAPAAFGPGPESGSSRPRTAPRPCPAGSGTTPRHRSASRRRPGLSTI